MQATATEIWVRSNRRPILSALLLGTAGIVLGLACIVIARRGDGLPWLEVFGGVGIALGLILATGLIWQVTRPRLAYRDGELLVVLRAGTPERLPIEIVEGFLLGKGPALLPGKSQRTKETTTLVIRLAEAAEEWAMRETHPTLGKWCGGYITIRGTWCEPLSLELVNRLNARLVEVKGQQPSITA